MVLDGNCFFFEALEAIKIMTKETAALEGRKKLLKLISIQQKSYED